MQRYGRIFACMWGVYSIYECTSLTGCNVINAMTLKKKLTSWIYLHIHPESSRNLASKEKKNMILGGWVIWTTHTEWLHILQFFPLWYKPAYICVNSINYVELKCMVTINPASLIIGCMYSVTDYPFWWLTYLFIGLWNQAFDAAVTVKEALKLLVADNKSLCLPKAVLSCIFPINQQALEHLVERGKKTPMW